MSTHPEVSPDLDPELVEPQGHRLVLDEADPAAAFRCKNILPRWAMMKMAAAAKTGDEMKMTLALMTLTESFLVPEERARFDAYMSDHDEALDRLDSAMSDLVNDIMGRPSQRVSPSSESSTTTPPSSRVVSFSRGTQHEVVPGALAESNSSTA